MTHIGDNLVRGSFIFLRDMFLLIKSQKDKIKSHCLLVPRGFSVKVSSRVGAKVPRIGSSGFAGPGASAAVTLWA